MLAIKSLQEHHSHTSYMVPASVFIKQKSLLKYAIIFYSIDFCCKGLCFKKMKKYPSPMSYLDISFFQRKGHWLNLMSWIKPKIQAQ
jgi:hypothetical protein